MGDDATILREDGQDEPRPYFVLWSVNFASQ